MLYKITNLLSTSVTVEDLGIRLSARGSCSVRAEMWAQSNDARIVEANRWVRADKQWVDAPVRPSAATRKAPGFQTPQDPPSQSEIKTPNVAFQPTSAISISQESFNRFLSNQEEMMKMMVTLAGSVPDRFEQVAKAIREMPAPAVVPFRPGMVQASEYSPAARGADPMFIPKTIVPENIASSIKVTESEVSTDVGGSVDALRKARGKKP